MYVTSKMSRDQTKVTAWLIRELSTDDAVNALRTMIETRVINPAVYTYATVDYDVSKGLDRDVNSPGHYALKFGSRKQGVAMVFVHPITAGYHGSGPHACYECLQLMGFLQGRSKEDCKELFSKEVYYDEGVRKENPVISLTYYK